MLPSLKIPAAVAQAKPPLPISENEMARHAGRYVNRWPIDIFVRDGQLFLKQGGAELPVTKVGDNRFASGAPTAQEFLIVTRPQGKPAYLQMFLWVFKKVQADRVR